MAGAPWIDSKQQQAVVARDGDVWIACPAKSGTNWMMNVVHQLISGGDDSFESIYDVVPWPEWVWRPGAPVEDMVRRVEALAGRRAFKSHAAPPDLPFIRAGSGKDVKYVVVARHPDEAIVSFKIFIDQHTDAFFDLWQLPRAALTRPTFEAFYREVMEPRQMQGMFHGFVAGWWPLRHEPNVMLVHYSDMKRDLPGVSRKIASFLGIEPSDAQWAKIERHTTFAWMKEHETKFESVTPCPVPPLEHGSMVRKGKLGAAHEDGMTPRISADLRAAGDAILTDPSARRWLYEGGPIPR